MTQSLLYVTRFTDTQYNNINKIPTIFHLNKTVTIFQRYNAHTKVPPSSSNKTVGQYTYQPSTSSCTHVTQIKSSSVQDPQLFSRSEYLFTKKGRVVVCDKISSVGLVFLGVDIIVLWGRLKPSQSDSSQVDGGDIGIVSCVELVYLI